MCNFSKHHDLNLRETGEGCPPHQDVVHMGRGGRRYFFLIWVEFQVWLGEEEVWDMDDTPHLTHEWTHSDLERCNGAALEIPFPFSVILSPIPAGHR